MKKGFTLIELLIVIAIIGLLAGVVLASVGQSRVKAADAAAKEQLVQMRNRIQLLYDANGASYMYNSAPAFTRAECTEIITPGGRYGSVFEDPIIFSQYAALEKVIDISYPRFPRCGVQADGYYMTGYLNSGKVFCIDGTNALRTKNAAGLDYRDLVDGEDPPAITLGSVTCN